MVAVGAMAIEQRVAQAVRRDALAQRVPALGRRAASTPQRSNCSSPGPRASRRSGVGALLARPARPRPSARGSRSPPAMRADSSRASAASKGRRSWKNTSCRPMRPRPTGRQRRVRRAACVGRVEVEVDDAVELAHGDARPSAPAGRSRSRRAVVVHDGVARQVDRAEVADRRLAVVRDLDDLGAEVREVHDVARAAPSGCRRGWTASLKVIQPLPVWARVRIMRA